jgi:hypothetical protein
VSNITPRIPSSYPELKLEHHQSSFKSRLDSDLCNSKGYGLGPVDRAALGEHIIEDIGYEACHDEVQKCKVCYTDVFCRQKECRST